MLENVLNKLLKNVEIDKDRVIKSVYTVLDRYNLRDDEVLIYRKKLKPNEIFVTAVEECNLKTAKKLAKQKYANIFPAPITVLEYKNKYYLFMGSNRSVIFILKRKMPDCIIIKIKKFISAPIIITEANQTLEEIIKKQK